MKATEIKAGQKFESFYGNGSYKGQILVTRTTQSSIFVKDSKSNGEWFSERREGINSVEKYLQTGLWK